MLIPGMVVHGSRESRRGNSGGKNGDRAQRFGYGHWLSPSGEIPPTSATSIVFQAQPFLLILRHFLFFAASGIRGHISHTIRLAALGARPTI
jgi:hypothetical protein